MVRVNSMYYKTFNVKQDSPTVALAIANIEIEINVCRLEGIKVLKIIHGYGSHGTGGEIKRALGPWLKINKRKHFIQDYIMGETFPTSPRAKFFKEICPEIMGDAELYYANPGVTILLL